MIRATSITPAGQWHGAAADTVTLDYDARHRRRMAMTGTGGLAFLLDLAEALPLRHGDAIDLEDGRRVAVVAAPEPLAEITAHTPAELLRLAWHLGNRHLPAQIEARRILIRQDHVIEAMVANLGAHVAQVSAPFDPEGGAYAGSGGHHHHAHEHSDAAHDHHLDEGALEHDDRLDDGTSSG